MHGLGSINMGGLYISPQRASASPEVRKDVGAEWAARVAAGKAGRSKATSRPEPTAAPVLQEPPWLRDYLRDSDERFAAQIKEAVQAIEAAFRPPPELEFWTLFRMLCKAGWKRIRSWLTRG